MRDVAVDAAKRFGTFGRDLGVIETLAHRYPPSRKFSDRGGQGLVVRNTTNDASRFAPGCCLNCGQHGAMRRDKTGSMNLPKRSRHCASRIGTPTKKKQSGG